MWINTSEKRNVEKKINWLIAVWENWNKHIVSWLQNVRKIKIECGRRRRCCGCFFFFPFLMRTMSIFFGTETGKHTHYAKQLYPIPVLDIPIYIRRLSIRVTFFVHSSFFLSVSVLPILWTKRERNTTRKCFFFVVLSKKWRNTYLTSLLHHYSMHNWDRRFPLLWLVWLMVQVVLEQNPNIPLEHQPFWTECESAMWNFILRAFRFDFFFCFFRLSVNLIQSVSLCVAVCVWLDFFFFVFFFGIWVYVCTNTKKQVL